MTSDVSIAILICADSVVILLALCNIINNYDKQSTQ